jgi:hypothetical protein
LLGILLVRAFASEMIKAERGYHRASG